MITVRNILRACSVALLFPLAGGCIRFDHSALGEPVEPRRSLEQHPCCEPVRGMEVHPLPVNRYVTLVVDEDDPVIEFRSGKSFAKAVQLPVIDDEYVLQVDSVVNIPRLDFFQEALFPMVTLLDAQLEPVAVYDDLEAELRNPFIGPKLLRILVTVEAGSKARYALVHTSQERTRYGMALFYPYEVVAQDGFDSMIYARPSQSAEKIHFVETGMLTLLAYHRASGFPPVPGPSIRER